MQNKLGTVRAISGDDPALREGAIGLVRPDERAEAHVLFRALWVVTSALLLLAITAATYSVAWEYSTRRYVKGFSDAIVPSSSAPEEKVDAILHWMSNGPARLDHGPDGSIRDPTETLNYASLLKVCGTATNAFVNLADSAGLSSRRLLLLDSNRRTMHVVAEVLVDGRWIVVDPVFRTVLRDSAGRTVTRKDLTNRSVFLAATSGIPGYDPAYTYDRTEHVRMARLGGIGSFLRVAFGRLAPGWEDSVTASLVLERESLATMMGAVLLMMALVLLRIFLRWYGVRRLGVYPPEMGARLLKAWSAYFDSGAGV